MILALKQATIDGGQLEQKTCQWFVAVMEGKYQFYRIYDTQVMTLNGHMATSAVMSRFIKEKDEIWTLQHTNEWFTVEAGLIKDVNTVPILF